MPAMGGSSGGEGKAGAGLFVLMQQGEEKGLVAGPQAGPGPYRKTRMAAFFLYGRFFRGIAAAALVKSRFFSFNTGMTADEKTSLARFLDLAVAALGSGYRVGEPDFRLSDDPDGETAALPAAPATDAATGSTAGKAADGLEQIAAEVRSCTACSLCETRTHAAPGEGADHPLVMVIGEGPGADEDATGRPFVGRAGQLLDKMLAAIGLSRERNCFIANVVKCRPPQNRDPLPEETAACAPFLERQIRLLQPGIIFCAGRIAAHTLLKTTESLGALRGKLFSFDSSGGGIPLIVSYHPSALLRNEELKRPAWEDLKMLRSAIMPVAEQGGAGDSGAGRDC